MNDGSADRQTDTKIFGGHNIIPLLFVAGHKNGRNSLSVLHLDSCW